ncbi:MAG: permease [Planctomycetota bacterium]
MSENQYKWARSGDVNAFFGLMLDNIANMMLCVVLLSGVFSFPVDFALRYMIPGTAIGVFVGDMLYFWLAIRMARKENRSDVTAMPLGLDTPSTFGMVFLVLGPAFASKLGQLTKEAGWTLEELRAAAEADLAGGGAANVLANLNHDAATFAWHIGICSIFVSGLLKIALSFGSNWIRAIVPRAGLLGSLAAIALVLIAFAPIEKIADNPLVGFPAMVIIFFTLIARGKLPFQLPGALGAVLIGCVIWYGLVATDGLTDNELVRQATESGNADLVWFPTEWLTVFRFEWLGTMSEAVVYFPIIFPFAIATVIGGIDCAESAASAGDDFDTGKVIGIEAVATLVASVCGGVIQSTPYIGHPAYKAMGGRAAYTLATAVFVAGAGLIGYFSLFNRFVPEAAVMPILLFIGLEITAQSFHVTPRRHFAAIALACMPAIAKLIVLKMGEPTMTLNVLAGGFIITSLLWASALAKIIDRRLIDASIYFAVGGILVLFGVIHSPLNDQMFWPWQLGQSDASGVAYFDAEQKRIVIEYAISYLLVAVILYGMNFVLPPKELEPVETDEAFEQLVE